MITTKGLGFLPDKKIIGTNRTGAALVVGGVYAVDVTGSATESTTADTNMGNIVACASANLRGFMVVATAATADDADGEFILQGVCQVLVDGGSIDIAEGDALIAQNASPNLIAQGTSGSPGTGDSQIPACAISLGTQTSSTATLTTVYFDGMALFKCGTGT